MSAARETIHLTHFNTAFGAMSLASSSRGVVACSLPGDGKDRVRTWLSERMPDARIVEGPGGASPSARRNANAVTAVRDYLAGRRRNLALPLDLRGTEFQKKVWAALRRVPYGKTISYGELAKAVGSPSAVRACGTANGSNPAPLFVPCHRAIAADGSLGGFAGGLPLKRRLLALESGEPLDDKRRKGARGTARKTVSAAKRPVKRATTATVTEKVTVTKRATVTKQATATKQAARPAKRTASASIVRTKVRRVARGAR